MAIESSGADRPKVPAHTIRVGILKACYDTAHLHKPQAAVLADVAAYGPHIGCFHLSNRSAERGQQHLPLRHADGDLDFERLIAAIADSGFAGPLSLEYLPQYHHHLLEDASWVAQMLRR